MKMFVFKFIILASILAGSYCMSVECFVQSRIECGLAFYEEKYPKHPITVEDVIEMCKEVISNQYCRLGVMERCAMNESFWDTDEHVEQLREEVKFIESSCDEDSPIFKAITKKLRCVVSNFERMHHICNWNFFNETVRQRIEDLVDEKEGCVVDAFAFYCKTAQIDLKCGNEARDAVAEILDKVYSSPGCREVRPRLSYFEAAFKSQYVNGYYKQEEVNAVLEILSQEKE